jgi:hypothetical protein
LFWWKTPLERDHLKDLGRGEYRIKVDREAIWWEAVERIFLAQGGVKG